MGRSVGQVSGNVVLDAHVLISALLKPFSIPADVVRLVLSEQVLLLHDAQILSEYREVAPRAKFGVDPELVTTLMDVFTHGGLSVKTSPLDTPLPDPDDKPFPEVTLGGGARIVLVTGKLRHFPTQLRRWCLV